MNTKRLFAPLALLALTATAAHATEGPVTWVDPTCGYFVVKLPGDNPAEAFGLFSLKANPLPEPGDILTGDLLDGAEITLRNTVKEVDHDAIHWASARSQEQLVRNTPVQCASKWKKKKR